jgi:NADH:ubiquinone oxidoreductase subunit E/ferredoxin
MFLPVIIVATILLFITVMLCIADKLLVSYGDCKVSVEAEGEKKEFTIQGGGTLLSALIGNGMSIPASCAGRGSCGFCKVNVRSGGGETLPTEEIFVSKEEQETGTRLACQVKIKNDVELYVPDLLTTVKGMVKNETFDTRLKWRFVTTEGTQPDADVKPPKFPRKAKREVLAIIDRHRDRPGAVMPILSDINESFNHLPAPAFQIVSNELSIPMSTVFRIATFYNAFSLKPRGKHVITICLGTACHVKGAGNILEKFEQELGIKEGETTEDHLFTLAGVRCIGCCGLAPVLKIGDDVHGLMTKKRVPELIEQYRGM